MLLKGAPRPSNPIKQRVGLPSIIGSRALTLLLDAQLDELLALEVELEEELVLLRHQ